jgi:hypothetical protein
MGWTIWYVSWQGLGIFLQNVQHTQPCIHRIFGALSLAEHSPGHEGHHPPLCTSMACRGITLPLLGQNEGKFCVSSTYFIAMHKSRPSEPNKRKIRWLKLRWLNWLQKVRMTSQNDTATETEKWGYEEVGTETLQQQHAFLHSSYTAHSSVQVPHSSSSASATKNGKPSWF